MYGGGSGTIAICGCSQQVRLTILRTRLIVRGCSRRAMRLACFTGCATFAILSLRYSVVADCVSATWTAPPPMIAQPAAQADSFAKAIRTDISAAFFCYFYTGNRAPGITGGLSICHRQRRDRLTGQRR